MNKQDVEETEVQGGPEVGQGGTRRSGRNLKKEVGEVQRSGRTITVLYELTSLPTPVFPHDEAEGQNS